MTDQLDDITTRLRTLSDELWALRDAATGTCPVAAYNLRLAGNRLQETFDPIARAKGAFLKQQAEPVASDPALCTTNTQPTRLS